MVWGPESYTRLLGSGQTLLGAWTLRLKRCGAPRFAKNLRSMWLKDKNSWTKRQIHQQDRTALLLVPQGQMAYLIEDSTGADYCFRTNGTFTRAELGEIDIFGIFEINAATMRTGETRASVTVDGSELVYNVIYGGQFRFDFSLAGGTLTLDDGMAAFTRVTVPLDDQSNLGHRTPMLIYKIFRGPEWATLRQSGTTPGAPIDVADGYIHFSTAAQAGETAAKHFAGQDDLFLIAVDADALGDDLKWEMSRGDALFPHLYREMQIGDVHWAQPLPLVDGAHQFPAGAGFDG